MSTTDDDIHVAYGCFGDALAPPTDLAERVGRRIAVRRRRRRTALTGTGLAVVAVVTGIALSHGGDEDRSAAADPRGSYDPTSTLVLTRADGSTYTFDEVSVTCEPADSPGGGRVAELTSPFRLDGPEDSATRLLVPFLQVRVPVDGLPVGEPVDLRSTSRASRAALDPESPSDLSDLRTPGLVLFMADSVGGRDSNEVASSQPGTDGSLTVLEASCEPVPVLRFRVEAALGSEVDQGPLGLAGEVD